MSDGNLNHVSAEGASASVEHHHQQQRQWPSRPASLKVSKWRKSASLPYIHHQNASSSYIRRASLHKALKKGAAMAKKSQINAVYCRRRKWSLGQDQIQAEAQLQKQDSLPRFPKLNTDRYYSGVALASILSGQENSTSSKLYFLPFKKFPLKEP